MKITVDQSTPLHGDGWALLQAAQAHMASLYAPTENFALPADALAQDTVTFLVARIKGKAVGCAALKRFDEYGEIKAMFVDAASRRAGVADALMQDLIARTRSFGLSVLRLETGPDLAAALRVYRRHGFIKRGPFGCYPEGPASVFMELQL